jgi:hypothetical protein
MFFYVLYCFVLVSSLVAYLYITTLAGFSQEGTQSNRRPLVSPFFLFVACRLKPPVASVTNPSCAVGVPGAHHDLCCYMSSCSSRSRGALSHPACIHSPWSPSGCAINRLTTANPLPPFPPSCPDSGSVTLVLSFLIELTYGPPVCDFQL